MAEAVLYQRLDHAARLVLNRPEKRNALSPSMIHQLDDALRRASCDEQVRAVILTGNGPAFCAGADLELGQELAASGRQGKSPFASLLRRLQTLSKPVIAAVNGPAFGGGLGLVAAADIAIASREAVFSFSEVRLGLIPAMISVLVLPKIGPHHARRLFLTGRRFTAEEALEYQLIHRTRPADQLASAVDEEVAEIAKGGPEAIAEAKRLIEQISGLKDSDEAFERASTWFAQIAQSDEAREGLAAFTEKRAPRWRP